jgi:hypothetical protein
MMLQINGNLISRKSQAQTFGLKIPPHLYCMIHTILIIITTSERMCVSTSNAWHTVRGGRRRGGGREA